LTEANLNHQVTAQAKSSWLQRTAYKYISLSLTMLLFIYAVWIYSKPQVDSKQVVILKPTLTENSKIVDMQQELVISAVEDALRQAVINTQGMYLISQREVKAITKAYPNDLNKLRQATGASDIISTELNCDNSRCKVHFSRLVAKTEGSNKLTVESEKNWLAPIDKFNAIFSTSQTQFASLYPEHDEVNQSGLVQKPIKEADYREYIALYNEIKEQGKYSDNSLMQLEALLARSPYLYAAYGLYRETASNLYVDTRDKAKLNRLDEILQQSPPEYRYSVYHAEDSFWLASYQDDTVTARLQIREARSRGADELTLIGFEAFLFFKAGNYKQAAKSYQNAFNLRPSTGLLYNKAFSYWRLGDLDKAVQTLNRMLKVVPNNYIAKRLQANIWLMQGKLELAILAYETIVANTNDGSDLSNLSIAYGLNKQYQKSLEFAQKALDKNPKHPVDLLNMADIEMILGYQEAARFHYQQVVTNLAGSDDIKELTYLAQAYAQLNQANLAIEVLSKAQALAPENGEVSYASAIVYSLLGEKSSAVYYVKTALSGNTGIVWFNLPWFDGLCIDPQFQLLMKQYANSKRCFN
jgi:serine/threonine-protein kinase